MKGIRNPIKPHIRLRNGEWICGILVDISGSSPADAYEQWRKAKIGMTQRAKRALGQL